MFRFFGKRRREKQWQREKKHYRKFSAAAVLAACILVLDSIMAVAAYRYLSPAQAAKEAGNELLKEAFMGENVALQPKR